MTESAKPSLTITKPVHQLPQAHSKKRKSTGRQRAQAWSLLRCHRATRALWHLATDPLCSTTLPVTLFTMQASAGCSSFILKPPQEDSLQQAGIYHCHLPTQQQVENSALQPAPKSVQDRHGSKCAEDIVGKGRALRALSKGFFTYSHQHTDVSLPPCPLQTARLFQISSCLCMLCQPGRGLPYLGDEVRILETG